MIVDPSLTTHPKFLALKEAVGAPALEYLIRIWAHCQMVKRGGNWGKVSPQYVETVAGYTAPRVSKGFLYESLLLSLNPGEKGFIERDPEGNLIIHDWDTWNKGLRSNWLNGSKGGRPREHHGEPTGNPRVLNGLTQAKPKANPRRTQGEPIGEDRIGEEYPLPPANAGVEDFQKTDPPEAGTGETERRGDGEEAVVPTPEEMATRLMGAGLLLETARKYHAWHSEKKSWLTRRPGGGLAVRSWEREVLRWQSEDRGQNAAGHASRSSGDGPAELEQVNAELQWQEDPKRVEILNKKRRELERNLSSANV